MEERLSEDEIDELSLYDNVELNKDRIIKLLESDGYKTKLNMEKKINILLAESSNKKEASFQEETPNKDDSNLYSTSKWEET